MATYRSIWKPNHPLAVGIGIVGEHRLRLYEHLGDGVQSCHWCGIELRWGRGTLTGTLTVDHLDGNTKNNRLDNLVPSCHGCNVMRGRVGHKIGRDELYILAGKDKSRKWRAERRNCLVCGKDFLHPIAQRRPKSGRFCSLSCAARGRTLLHKDSVVEVGG